MGPNGQRLRLTPSSNAVAKRSAIESMVILDMEIEKEFRQDVLGMQVEVRLHIGWLVCIKLEKRKLRT